MHFALKMITFVSSHLSTLNSQLSPLNYLFTAFTLYPAAFNWASNPSSPPRYTALSVINALVVALCLKCPHAVKRNLEMLEETWNNYQVYLNDEIDFIDENALMSGLSMPECAGE